MALKKLIPIKNQQLIKRNLYLFFILINCFLPNTPLLAKTKTSNKTLADSVAVLNSLCKELRYSNPEKALQIALNAKSMITKEDKTGQATTNLNLGRLYTDLAEYLTALNYLHSSLEIFEKTGNDNGRINTLYSISKVYLFQGNYPESLSQCLKALSIAEKTNDKQLKAKVTNAVGILYHYQQEYLKAKNYYEIALNLRKEIGNERDISGSLNNLATVFKDLEEYEKALEYYNKALAIVIRIDDKLSVADYHANLGMVYYLIKDYPKAIEHYSLSNSIFHSIKSTDGEAYVHYGMAKLYNKTKQFKLARDHGFQGLKKSLQIGSKEYVSDVTFEIYKCYKGLNNIDSALYYYEMHTMYKDSVFNDNKSRAIASIQMNYELEKKENKIKMLNTEVSFQTKLRNLGIIILVLVSVLFISIYKRIKLKTLLLQKNNELEKEKMKQLKLELDSKNRELTTQSMVAIQKNQVLDNLKSELQNIQDKKGSFTQALQLVDNQYNIDKDWEVLKVHFEKVHTNFFQNLKSTYPKLTMNDLRHCAYIKLQMQTKDVARIMNVEPKSVQMTRYRLKKKLNLNEQNSLEDFLTSY